MSDIGARGSRHPLDGATTRPPMARSRRGTEPNGWWGMILFLGSEAAIFGSLIGTYFFLDFHIRHWPPPGVELPSVTAPAIAVGGLTVTVVMMWASVHAARGGHRRRAMAWIAFGLAVQAAYLGVEVVLFRQDLMKLSPRSSAYGSIYFTLLAADHAHVILGLLLSVGILWKLWRRGLNNYWFIGVRGLALYWYVVIALTILVLFTTLSPSL